ncbi:MAG: septum formation protein Maf [Candidatus Omnitrophica bacterium]|nr:septum formation protein Maf [Candidatus Omnitrophota bacterium]MBD3269728.1 septum formation protein Maf [Candidatus Omnitrophota bacterium]
MPIPASTSTCVEGSGVWIVTVQEIILASKSKARRQLLEETGLKFYVFDTKLEEDFKHYGSCVKAVVGNALEKAKKASAEFPSGIIIGADTLCYADKKIIGKPKSLEEARRNLRFLSRHPHWVYTGLALIGGSKGKVFTAFEKSRIFMLPLSDKQISGYFSKISPKDLAGGFDIRGRGAFFIRRIEGCFYNIVGLPLSKLYVLFRRVGIDLLKD